MAAPQEAESVGSASPADAAALQSRASVPAASDTGASAVRAQATAARVGTHCTQDLPIDIVLASLCSRDICLRPCIGFLHPAPDTSKIGMLTFNLYMPILSEQTPKLCREMHAFCNARTVFYHGG